MEDLRWGLVVYGIAGLVFYVMLIGFLVTFANAMFRFAKAFERIADVAEEAILDFEVLHDLAETEHEQP